MSRYESREEAQAYGRALGEDEAVVAQFEFAARLRGSHRLRRM